MKKFTMYTTTEERNRKGGTREYAISCIINGVKPRYRDYEEINAINNVVQMHLGKKFCASDAELLCTM